MMVELTGVSLEVGAVGLAIFFVIGLHMPLHKRLAVSTIFACRLLYVHSNISSEKPCLQMPGFYRS